MLTKSGERNVQLKRTLDTLLRNCQEGQTRQPEVEEEDGEEEEEEEEEQEEDDDMQPTSTARDEDMNG